VYTTGVDINTIRRSVVGPLSMRDPQGSVTIFDLVNGPMRFVASDVVILSLWAIYMQEGILLRLFETCANKRRSASTPRLRSGS
jgi:hypothetical protein